MTSEKIIAWIKKDLVKKTIGVIILYLAVSICIHAYLFRSEDVIIWDIKSYYSYLPATFIYFDLSLDFVYEVPGKFADYIWPMETPTGKKAIETTYGMAFLYTPFFLVGHLVALLTDFETHGYSRPYQLAMHFSALFYVWIGLLYLWKVLRRYFNDRVTAFTLFAVALGTNLFYYTTVEAPMTHAFSFGLFAVFLWRTIVFYDHPTIKNILVSGALAGLIALIRPTNIIILLVFFLWDIKTRTDLMERLRFFTGKAHWVLLMASVFVLVWVPQFIYWYNVSGQIFFFTYGERGASFFFGNPQICNILFSYKKGWLVYTPLMVFALAGVFLLPRRVPGAFPAILIFTIINIYILASWWSWWFGGGFGLRSFIDSYALLAIPFACFVDMGLRRPAWPRWIILVVMVVLIGYNQFQTRQYINNAIHWWWMNKEAYWETFLKRHPTERFWHVITIPDYEAARKGVYRELKSPGAVRHLAENQDALSWHEPLSEQDIITWITGKLWLDNDWQHRLSPELFYRYGADTLTVARVKASWMYDEKGFDYWDKRISKELIIRELKSDTLFMEKVIRPQAEDGRLSADSLLLIYATERFCQTREECP